MNGHLLTLDQVADYLNVPVKTVRRWRLNDSGPRFIRVGRHVRCDPDDLAQWIKDQKRAERRRTAP